MIDISIRISELEEEVKQLRALLNGDDIFFIVPTQWKMFRQEREMLRALVNSSNGFRSHNSLITIIPRRIDGEDPLRLVYVIAARLRKSLRDNLGIEMKSSHSEGYWLSAADREKIKAVIQIEVDRKVA